ncbi:hypothetical protein L1987_65392 [Smallanthus sonchifolius]|uniref:Uncharacterized protein n=1 Tax=Smallanthus sonchifolius TaxID=185202 RepID=A0ACB9BU83_9ASTR|nr:hypothetical protein L1987_65392 [Smallanthus sonchifolius]
MMPNTKTHNADSKTVTTDSRNNHGDLKNINSDSNMNNKFDWKQNQSDLKNNPDSKTNADPSLQGDMGGDAMPHSSAATPPPERQHSHNGSKVYKSGPLFLSSKGVFSVTLHLFIDYVTIDHRCVNIQNAATQKGGEANLTLGGIDLNSSGSVVMKADKKLLTVLFPDGRDGRAFTLKAETSDDLYEWKDALEAALSDAPSAVNGISKNDKGDAADGSEEHSAKDQKQAKSTVLGRPILLALEDIDGTPSFLEKALCYVEDFGVNVEGILRQAADVDDVERRIQEYEQGNVDFIEDEDGHVIGDCIKALCSSRVTFTPSPSILLCGIARSISILIMMEAVAENKAVNRMSVSAVAACMSPLLLRPLLAGDVELEKGSDIGGDGSVQLLQAAAAANHAQAIVITLVEEYDKIFGEEDMLSDLYSDSDEYGSESGSDEYYEEDEYSDDDDDDVENITEDSCSYDEDSDHGSGTSYSDSGDDKGTASPISISNGNPKVKNGSPLESIAYVTDQQAEIVRLEANKAKLKERIESEARRIAILKEDLGSKKRALDMRHVALLEEVSRLENLQKVPLSASTDEKDVLKKNADSDNTDQSEATDPGLQMSEQNSNDLGLQHKEKDHESTTASHRIKDTNSNKEQGDRHQFHSHPSKHHERAMSKSTSSRRPHSKGEP